MSMTTRCDESAIQPPKFFEELKIDLSALIYHYQRLFREVRKDLLNHLKTRR